MNDLYSSAAIATLLALGNVAEAADTLRVDYYHSGDRDTEIFSLERLVREPLPWPGNPDRPIDATLRGKYLAEVYPNGADTPSYSRSFSSIYGEWETTGEARRMQRTFHESIRVPDPGKPFELVVSKRGADHAFVEVWRIELNPSDYLVERATAPLSDSVIAIEKNGDPAHKVDLLLLGDGYTADETERFIQTARRLTDVLFSTPPFSERRSDFNVWALAPESADSGVSRPSTGTWKNTPLGVAYDAFRSERYVLTYENRKLREIAASAPYDAIEILTNTDTYGGGGIYGLYSTAAANSEWADYLFIHEFAHHFAGLADEYYTSSVAYEASGIDVEPYEPNVTALLDPAKLKWRHYVDADTSLPTDWPKAAYEAHSIAYQEKRAAMRSQNVPEAEMNELFRDNQEIVEGMFSEAPNANRIGAFQGAMYSATGYYRSEMNCIMFTRSDDFCRVCADAIEAVIDEYTAN